MSVGEALLFGFRGECMAQLSLALPVSLSMICNRVMSLTSVAFVGHMGPLPLAGAVGPARPCLPRHRRAF
jgi:Na+-driven multidrug efflux pump